MTTLTLNMNFTFELNSELTASEIEEFSELLHEELTVLWDEYEDGVPKTFNDDIDDKIDTDASVTVELVSAKQNHE